MTSPVYTLLATMSVYARTGRLPAASIEGLASAVASKGRARTTPPASSSLYDLPTSMLAMCSWKTKGGECLRIFRCGPARREHEAGAATLRKITTAAILK